MYEERLKWRKEILSKERLVNGLKAFGRLRIQTSHASIMCYSALLLILFVAFTIRILPLRWEIPTGTVRLNEFDPYYQYSLTNKMVHDGLFSPYLENNGAGWINYQQWYPGGLNMGQSLPALPMTAAILYNIISLLSPNVNLMAFVSILPAVMGALSCLIIYFIGKDMGGKAIGLFAALFLALAPSFLQRSALGFFDTEVPGVLGLLLFMFLLLRATEGTRSLRSSLFYSLAAAGALAYFVTGWGAAYYMMDLTALYFFVLILLRRYTQRLLFNYSIIFGLALFVVFFKFGASIISGSLTLGIMILPIIVTTSREALESVPQTFREVSRSLGASKWQTIRHAVLPNAISGILTGTILGLGRAAGETAPILFTVAAFYLPQLPSSIFDQVMALPYHLYVISTQVPNVDEKIRYGTALVLLALVLFMNLVAIIIRYKFRKNKKW